MTHIAGALMSLFSVALVFVLFWHLRSAVRLLPEEEQSKLQAARGMVRRISLASLLLSALAIGVISLLSALRMPPFSPGQALAVSLPLMWVMFGVPFALLDEVMVLSAATSGSVLSLTPASWLLCVSIAVVPMALSILSVQLLMSQKLVGLSESLSGCAFAVASMSLAFFVAVAVSSSLRQGGESSFEPFFRSPMLVRAIALTAAGTLMMTLAIAIHHPSPKGESIFIIAYPVALSAALLIGWHIASGVILIGGERLIKFGHIVHPVIAGLVFALIGSAFAHASIKPYSHLFRLGVVAFIFVAVMYQLLIHRGTMAERDISATQQFGIAASLLVLGMIAVAFAAHRAYGVGVAGIGFLPAAHFFGVLASWLVQMDSEFRKEQFWRMALVSNLPIIVLAMRLMYERQVQAAILPSHSPIVLVSACAGALTFTALTGLVTSSSGNAIASALNGFWGLFAKSLLALARIGLIAVGFAVLLPMLWGASASFGFIIGVAISTLMLCTMPGLNSPSLAWRFAILWYVALTLMLCIGIVHTTQLLIPLSLRPRLFRVWMFIGLLLLTGIAWGLLGIARRRIWRSS